MTAFNLCIPVQLTFKAVSGPLSVMTSFVRKSNFRFDADGAG